MEKLMRNVTSYRSFFAQVSFGALALSWVAALLLFLPTVWAATPPALVNYEGVLRSASDAPLTGTYDMVFRFFDAPTLGSEVVVDFHKAANGGAVSVSGGLFNLQLGGGSVTDGSGPGTYTDLAAMFRDYPSVYLEVHIAGEVLSPRTRIVSAAYAFNASNLAGRDAAYYLDASSTAQTKTGSTTFDASTAASGYGVRAIGVDGGLYCSDATEAGRAEIGTGNWGIRAFGVFDASGLAGSGAGYFRDTTYFGEAFLGHGATGIDAYGTYAGGIFRNGSTSAYSNEALLAHAGYGIWAQGDSAGGYFKDRDGSGYAQLGYEHFDGADYGIRAVGTRAGLFETVVDGAAYVYLADQFSKLGIHAEGGAPGSGAGTGVEAYGGYKGGRFVSTSGWGDADVGTIYYGINAKGTYNNGGAAGEFRDPFYSGRAFLGVGDTGIVSHGTYAGGIFRNGYPTYSIETYLATGNSGIYSTGPKNFVQNHPLDKDRVIVYTSPEGDEVSTYTRGSARLQGGVARVALGETFQWVTSPDIGLTAQVTPRGSWSDLYVEQVTPTELVVRSREGESDAEFDYMVWGLRIGFERSSVVREKDIEALIPPMNFHEEQYARHPELARFSAFDRFKTMEATRKGGGPQDFSRSEALKTAVGVYDPAHPPAGQGRVLTPESQARFEAEKAAGLWSVPTPREPDGRTGSDGGDQSVDRPPVARADPPGSSAESESGLTPSFPRFAIPVQVEGSVEPGDVLTNDPSAPAILRRSTLAEDPGVVGIVAGEPGSSWRLTAPIALSGTIVRCKVDANYGSIVPNDLLVSSPTPGHAMRSLSDQPPRPGTIIGKALEPLESGTGSIQILVMPR